MRACWTACTFGSWIQWSEWLKDKSEDEGLRDHFYFSEDYEPVLVDLFQELRPSPLKKSPHTVSCTSNVRLILIELFTVLKNQININYKCLQIQVSENENACLIKITFSTSKNKLGV